MNANVYDMVSEDLIFSGIPVQGKGEKGNRPELNAGMR